MEMDLQAVGGMRERSWGGRTVEATAAGLNQDGGGTGVTVRGWTPGNCEAGTGEGKGSGDPQISC